MIEKTVKINFQEIKLHSRDGINWSSDVMDLERMAEVYERLRLVQLEESITERFWPTPGDGI